MQEIQLYSNLASQIDAIDRLGDTFAKSGMFKCTRIEQGRTIVVMCITMGITPTEFIARYDLIDGVPRKKALACLADFRKAGGRHKWLTDSDDPEKAIGEFSFEGQSYKVKFTIADAQRQGLVRPNSNWIKTPSNMLRARVITTAIGMLAPEIVAGSDDEPAETAVSSVPLNLSQGPAIDVTSTPVSSTSKVAELPPAQDPKDDEKELSKMGLAPETPNVKIPILLRKQPTRPAAKEDTGPIPPPKVIEPDVPPAKAEPTSKTPEKHNPLIPPDQLDEDTVEAMGMIFQGHFLEVANWMIKNCWINPAETELQTEVQAAIHLKQNLPFLTKTRAKRVLTKKLAFMRAVEEITP